MPAILYHIPLVLWVRGTIEKMTAAGSVEFSDWSGSWIQTYKDLGGEKTSGEKLCPQHAAYALWRLGRITNSGMPVTRWTLEEVKAAYGPNAVYAVLVLDLLAKDRTVDSWTQEKLWSKVRALYSKQLGKVPAKGKEGALQVALGLLRDRQIVLGESSEGN